MILFACLYTLGLENIPRMSLNAYELFEITTKDFYINKGVLGNNG